MSKMCYRISLDTHSSKSFFCFFVNFISFNNSGLLSNVLFKALFSFHCLILSWSPESNTSGTWELLNFSGVEFGITGGSDSDGFPMRKDLPGTQKRKLLLTKGVGFKGKLRGKRFGGLRVKKTVAGNTVHE